MSAHFASKPQENSPPEEKGIGLQFRGFLKLWPYLWPKNLKSAKTRLVLALASMILGKMTLMCVPLFFKDLVDSLDKHTMLTLPLFMVAAYAGARLLSGLFSDLRDGIFAVIGERAMRDAATRVFRHMHNLSLTFHLERKTGALSQTISRGIKSIEEFMQFSTFMLLPTMVEVLFVVFVFFKIYGGWVAFACLLTLATYIIATVHITEWRMSYIKSMNISDAEANHKAIDSLLNFETVKYFGNEEHEIKRYDHMLQKYEISAVKSKLTLTVLNSAQNIITSMGLLVIVLLTVVSFQRGEITLGGVIAVNAYLLQLYAPLYTVGFAYRQVRLSLLNMDMMFELLNVTKDIEDRPGAVDLNIDEPDITFEHVDFSYSPSRKILKNISFHVPARSTLAIVGHSGAGKSTLSKLLYRFYDVTGGVIKVGGKDIRALTQKSLRQMIGIVPQDTVLFNDTVAYNIFYGNPEASYAEMVDASKRAQIHDFIAKLPEGYETMVGERGLKLSGGEKQRIAIARTLLKRPKIFLFDEATSSLDSKTEKDIQAQLLELSESHTTLIIAHRLSTVIHADKIIVLKHGEIMESGTHQELLLRDGIYSRLWEAQGE